MIILWLEAKGGLFFFSSFFLQDMVSLLSWNSLQTKLASNSYGSLYLCLPGAGLKGVRHPAKAVCGRGLAAWQHLDTRSVSPEGTRVCVPQHTPSVPTLALAWCWVQLECYKQLVRIKGEVIALASVAGRD